MNIQTFSKSVGDYGCLALTYIHIACRLTGTEWSDVDALRVIREAMTRGYVGDDCFVRDPVGLMRLATGKNFDVRKTSVSNARGPWCAVRYERDGKAHWVEWNVNHGLSWNSLDYSNCVSNGNPVLTDIRDVIIR